MLELPSDGAKYPILCDTTCASDQPNSPGQAPRQASDDETKACSHQLSVKSRRIITSLEVSTECRDRILITSLPVRRAGVMPSNSPSPQMR